MSDTRSDRLQRTRELVFALCTAWLLVQNTLLFALIAWQPLAGLRIATLVLLRVAIQAAATVTILPGAGLLDVACVLLSAGTGADHV